MHLAIAMLTILQGVALMDITEEDALYDECAYSQPADCLVDVQDTDYGVHVTITPKVFWEKSGRCIDATPPDVHVALQDVELYEVEDATFAPGEGDTSTREEIRKKVLDLGFVENPEFTAYLHGG